MTLILRSEHIRILDAAQKRYDAELELRYERGRWDGVAIGMGIGFIAGMMLVIGIMPFGTGYVT